MDVLEFLVPFYPINTAWVFFSSDLKMDPLNLYPYILIPLYSYTFAKKNKTNKKIKINVTRDMWHLTRDIWHMTRDMWHVVGGEHCIKVLAL